MAETQNLLSNKQQIRENFKASSQRKVHDTEQSKRGKRSEI